MQTEATRAGITVAQSTGMRSTTNLLLATGLVLVGCGDNLEPSTDDQTEIQTVEEDVPGDPPPSEEPVPVGEIDAFLGFYSPSCTANIADLEVVASYTDGTPLTNPHCKFTFADGSVVEGCAIQHEFAVGGEHFVNLYVEDLATGAVFNREQRVFVYPVSQVTLDVSAPACGLSLSYLAASSEGGEGFVDVTPRETVIGHDPQARQATLQVSAPGTYSVRFHVEDERANGPICEYEVVKEVTVVECPDEHEHEPSCGH